MRALVITEPGSARVEDVEVPVPGAGQVVVDVRRAGICGTDVELFTGQLAYFAQGKTGFPLRPGHEWCGVVSALGDGVDSGWLRARVTGDTMLGCGRCPRCLAGRGHVCADRREVGTIGLLSTAFAQAMGAEVHIWALARDREELAASFGASGYWTADDPPPVTGVVQVTVGLAEAAEALAGKIGPGAGTKIHIDPSA